MATSSEALPEAEIWTRAVRLHGRMDVRLDTFRLPAPGPGEMLVRIVTDSVCMSSFKLMSLGEEHQRVTAGLAGRPVMLGHEFCAEILRVGERWRGHFHPGAKVAVQPVLDYLGRPDAIGYSYPFSGGSATLALLPSEVMESGCLLPYAGRGWFYGSLAEPVACVLRAFRSQIHRDADGELRPGPVPGGAMALLGAMGPMGMAALDCALRRNPAPGRIVVTSRNAAKLAEAERIFPAQAAKTRGIDLAYLHCPNTRELPQAVARWAMGKEDPARQFDDVFVFAPDRDLVEAGSGILGKGGCLNMFAGPTDHEFMAGINFYKVHYLGAHVTGTYAAQTRDMREALDGIASGAIDPSFLVTHVGGLDAVPDLLPRLPRIPGWKKLIYPSLNLPLFALQDLPALAASDAHFAKLAVLVAEGGNRWNAAAESFLLNHTPWMAPSP